MHILRYHGPKLPTNVESLNVEWWYVEGMVV